MRPRDWFLVGTKLLGVYVGYRGLFSLAICFSNTFTASDSYVESSRAKSGVLLAALEVAIGGIMLFGTEPLTRLAFHEPAPERPDDTVDSENDPE